MELILWRHAEAHPGQPDSERALTAKGMRQAERMAAFLGKHLPQDARILVSPATRAQQTACALTPHFISAPNLGVHATPQTVIATAGWPDSSGCVLLVGHQPWLGELAALLLSGQAQAWHVKKGAIWWFSRKDGTQTRLRLVLSPDQL